MVNPIELLTEGQLSALRLVGRHQSSKEIARRLNISPHTVDQRLRAAMRHLGVASRFDAARLLAQYEGNTISSERQPRRLELAAPSSERESNLVPSDEVATDASARSSGAHSDSNQRSEAPISKAMTDDWKASVDRDLARLHQDTRHLLYALIASFLILAGGGFTLFQQQNFKIEGLTREISDLRVANQRLEAKLDFLIEKAGRNPERETGSR